MSSLGEALDHVGTANMYAAWWDSRADAKDKARCVKAGHDAVAEIDKAMRNLRAERERLVRELAADQRVFMAQFDAFDTYRPNIEAARDPAERALLDQVVAFASYAENIAAGAR